VQPKVLQALLYKSYYGLIFKYYIKSLYLSIDIFVHYIVEIIYCQT
jgi:hypothetical protein